MSWQSPKDETGRINTRVNRDVEKGRLKEATILAEAWPTPAKKPWTPEREREITSVPASLAD